MSPTNATAPAYENGNGRDIANAKISLKYVGAIILAIVSALSAFFSVKITQAEQATQLQELHDQVEKVDKKLDNLEEWIKKHP